MPQLRFNYVPGEVITYEVNTKTTREISKGAERLELQEQNVLTNVKVKTIAYDEEGYHVILTTQVKGFTSRLVKADGTESTYQASEEELSSTKPYKIYILFDPRGQVKDIIGGSEVPALVFPEEEVEVGGSWKEDVMFSLPMFDSPVRISLIYTLEDISGEVARIKVESEEASFTLPVKLTFDDKEQTFNADYVVDISGEFDFNLNLGIIQKHKLSMEAKVKMDLYLVEISSLSELRYLGTEH